MIAVEHRPHMRHRKLGRSAADQAVTHRGMCDRKILADQGRWRWVLREVAEHRLLRAGDLRIGPVVADAVAQTVLQLELELGAASMIVLRAVSRLRWHASDGGLAYA